jgi:hypothetical protein
VVEHEEFDRHAVVEELEQVRLGFHSLLTAASRSDLRRGTAGTRWTNEQMLFHMVFGYIIVLALLRLVGLFSRLPASASRGFARVLDAAIDFHRSQLTFGSSAG